MDTREIPVADGVALAVVEWRPGAVGSEPAAPFLLVHGLASNARLWDGVGAHLVSRGHEATAVDLRGHGRSSKPDAPYDIPTVADDLAVLVERLGLGRPIVAGQSWGGNVVLELAARHPDLVRGIVCVDGGWLEPCASFPSWEACLAALAPPRLAGTPLAEIEGWIRRAHPDWPETGIQGTLANFERRADGTIAPWLTYERHVAVLRGLWDHRPSEIYAGVRVPVLLLPADTGEQDRAAQKREGVDLAVERLPSARVRWLTGDHDIHAQHPAECADVMLEAMTDGFFG